MDGGISFSSTLYNVAMECALRRLHKDCKKDFGQNCDNCKVYIGRYIDADPRHIELYMIQVNTDAYSLYRGNNRHHVWCWLGIIVCLLLAWHYYKTEEERLIYWGVKEPKSTTSQTSTLNIQEDIDFALRQVDKDMSKKLDVNKDGLVNCIDAAVQFYKYFPDKDKVRITVNYNPRKDIHHLFNEVLINGKWVAVEPQAYYKNWYDTYSMHDIWGDKYVENLNEVVTFQYKQFVK